IMKQTDPQLFLASFVYGTPVLLFVGQLDTACFDCGLGCARGARDLQTENFHLMNHCLPDRHETRYVQASVEMTAKLLDVSSIRLLKEEVAKHSSLQRSQRAVNRSSDGVSYPSKSCGCVMVSGHGGHRRLHKGRDWLYRLVLLLPYDLEEELL